MKKVLASVLAGSMVLGMAAAASAAPNIKLAKSTGADREYDLQLFAPDGNYVTEAGEEGIDWSPITRIAWDAYVAEYNKYERAADSYQSLINDYFRTFADLTTARDTILDIYDAFYNAVGADANTTVSTNLYRGMDAVTTITNNNRYMGTALNGETKASVVYNASGAKYNNAEAKSIIAFFEKHSPDAIMDQIERLDLITVEVISGFTGNGTYAPHKTKWDMTDDENDLVTYMYTYGEDDAKEVRVNVWVKHGDGLRADVNEGKVSVSKKLVTKNWRNTDSDVYMLTIKAKADVRDFDLSDFEIELDIDGDEKNTYFIDGQVAYSDYREVDPDDRLTVTKSDRLDNQEDGCIFDFNEPIDETARIRCHDYVDLFFDGNYGTDKENLRVMDDDITEVEDFFQDYDIDYYDFIGLPKFAKDVRCVIDADSDSYIYEYDKKTGDVVDITDECEYTSDGWEFKRKSFKTYVILEEPYEGGNVKAEKEPVSEEPDDTDEVEEPKDEPSSEGSKPNPGTGAYPPVLI